LKTLKRPIKRRWALQGSTPLSKILADSIMCLTCAKIGMIQVIVPLETAVYICMIGQTTKLDGNLRNSLNSRRGKDGKELITPN
jgi:hypothetical protein